MFGGDAGFYFRDGSCGKIRIPLQVWSPWFEKPDSIHKDPQKSLSETRVIAQMIKESLLTKLFIIKPLGKSRFSLSPRLSIFLSSEDYRQQKKNGCERWVQQWKEHRGKHRENLHVEKSQNISVVLIDFSLLFTETLGESEENLKNVSATFMFLVIGFPKEVRDLQRKLKGHSLHIHNVLVFIFYIFAWSSETSDSLWTYVGLLQSFHQLRPAPSINIHF